MISYTKKKKPWWEKEVSQGHGYKAQDQRSREALKSIFEQEAHVTEFLEKEKERNIKRISLTPRLIDYTESKGSTLQVIQNDLLRRGFGSYTLVFTVGHGFTTNNGFRFFSTENGRGLNHMQMSWSEFFSIPNLYDLSCGSTWPDVDPYSKPDRTEPKDFDGAVRFFEELPDFTRECIPLKERMEEAWKNSRKMATEKTKDVVTP